MYRGVTILPRGRVSTHAYANELYRPKFVNKANKCVSGRRKYEAAEPDRKHVNV